MPTQRIILDPLRMRATPDIGKFVLYPAEGGEIKRRKLQATFSGSMRGKCFQIQDESGEVSWRMQRSFLQHFTSTLIQSMIGTDPQTTVRDLSYFYNCFFRRDIKDVLKSQKAVVLGFGPKWPELFLPHVDREGASVFPLASIMDSVIGIDYLIANIELAGKAMRKYFDGISSARYFPAVRHERDDHVRNPYQQEKDRVIEGAYSVNAGQVMSSLGKISLFHGAIEAMPESVLTPGSVALVSAVGVFDAEPLGLEGYNAEHENPDAVENVRDIFRRVHGMLSENGLMMIGRGKYVPGSNYALARVFESLAAEMKMSMIFMIPKGKTWKDDPENFFGFIKDGSGDLIFMDYPFPLPETIGLGCLGSDTKYPKWTSEHDFLPAGREQKIERKPNTCREEAIQK